MWHIQIPDRITTKLLVCCFNPQVIGRDLEGSNVPPDCRGIDADVQSANIEIHSA